MEYISPAEDALFVKALQWLAERTAERYGCEGDPKITRITSEEQSKSA